MTEMDLNRSGMKQFTLFLALVAALNHSLSGQQLMAGSQHPGMFQEVALLSEGTDPAGGTISGRLENYYTVINTINASGEIIHSELCYAMSDASVKDPHHMCVVTINQQGERVCRAMNVAEAAGFYKGGRLAPTKAPDSIIGSAYYYCWRNTDFMIRSRLMGTDLTTPGYYLDYGDKYSNRFAGKIRPRLSKAGRTWVDKTLVLLQAATETLVLANPAIEQNGPEFRKNLFAIHPAVYEAAGFFDLPLRDKLIIGLHVDLKDLFSREGRIQAKILAKDYTRYLAVKVLH